MFGIEADLDWSNIKGSVSNAFCGGTAFSCETKNTYLGTARGRIGVAADRVLLFATGGAAFGDIQMGLTSGSGTSSYDTATKVGWTGAAV